MLIELARFGYATAFHGTNAEESPAGPTRERPVAVSTGNGLCNPGHTLSCRLKLESTLCRK